MIAHYDRAGDGSPGVIWIRQLAERVVGGACTPKDPRWAPVGPASRLGCDETRKLDSLIVTTGVLFVSERSNFVSEESPPPLQAYFARLAGRPALARAAQNVESVFQPA